MNSKLRIAVIAACPFPLGRGTPIRIFRGAEALAARGHEVHVITYHLGKGPIPNGITLHRIPDVSFYKKLTPGPTYLKLLCVDVRLFFLARRLLRTLRFDIIHAHHYEGLLVGAFARGKLRIPLVYDAHTLLGEELHFYPLGLPGWFKKRFGSQLDSFLPRLADHTVCTSETIRSTLCEAMPWHSDKFSVISEGVEYEHFASLSGLLSQPQNTKKVIYAGNLAEYQGIDLLLKGFQEAVRQIPHARLVIATDSSFEPYAPLARKLGILDSIELVPMPAYDDLPTLFAATNVAVNPRVRCAGIPIKLLNYMAAGKPVVSFASSAPGLTHGETAWLAEDHDVKTMAEGMVTLLNEEEYAQRLGAAAQSYVAKHCRWPLLAECYEHLFRQLQASNEISNFD